MANKTFPYFFKARFYDWRAPLKMASQSLIQTGRTPSKKWSGQNLTGRTAGSGPDKHHGIEASYITVHSYDLLTLVLGFASNSYT